MSELEIYTQIEEHFYMKRDWYRIHDSKSVHGAFHVTRDEAQKWNELGWGIFHTINEFSGNRKIENLTDIYAWAVDIDRGTKEEQLEKIKYAPLFPSLVVETKSGFHVYFHSQGARPENYQAIVLDRLVPCFNADPKARDIARLLRVPGFKHQKDITKPFVIRVHAWNPCWYTESDMLFAFRLSEEKQKELSIKQQFKSEAKKEIKTEGDDLWERIYNMDCEEALCRLSGTSYVGGETYSFKKTPNGKQNILVNGKSTSCWLDQSKRIGSLDKGGPTIFNWLKWFGRSNASVIEIMKGVFPELWNKSGQMSA